MVTKCKTELVSKCETNIFTKCETKMITRCKTKLVTKCKTKLVTKCKTKLVTKCETKMLAKCETKLVPNVRPKCSLNVRSNWCHKSGGLRIGQKNKGMRKGNQEHEGSQQQQEQQQPLPLFLVPLCMTFFLYMQLIFRLVYFWKMIQCQILLKRETTSGRVDCLAVHGRRRIWCKHTVPVAFSEARFQVKKSACFWSHGRYQE